MSQRRVRGCVIAIPSESALFVARKDGSFVATACQTHSALIKVHDLDTGVTASSSCRDCTPTTREPSVAAATMQCHRVIQNFHDRLTAAVSRSPLLKASISPTSRLLDCSRLRVVAEELPETLLDVVVEGQKALPIDLRLKVSKASTPIVSPGRTDRIDGKADDVAAGKSREKELQQLYHLLDQRIHRHAEQAKRQTGVHAIWLGYPLLHVSTGIQDTAPWLLAPVFLWPVSVEPDARHSGRILIGRDSAAGPPQFNRVMASWIRRQFQLQLIIPNDESLEDLDRAAIRRFLTDLSNQFEDPPQVDCHGKMQSVPSTKLLMDRLGHRLFHAAVLGVFQSKDEAVLADLDAMKNMDLGDGLVAAFADGKQLPTVVETAAPPPEEDRYLVSEADFSQERAVWKARENPSLVVHGPPGTGKSQTIVNLIADALAHGRTVLTICQKQAATRVVMERLRAAALDDLCVEVYEPEADRKAIFNQIRTQVGALPHNRQDQSAQQQRLQLGGQITALERELERYARALREKHPTFRLSYSELKSQEGETLSRFPTARQLVSPRLRIGEFSAEELNELCQKVEQTGLLYRHADPLNNPWRYRQPSVRMSAILSSDVDARLNRLAELNAQHVEHIKRLGPGIEQQVDPHDFVTTAPEAVRQLQILTEDRPTAAAQLTRRWLRAVKPLEDVEIDCLAGRCQEAMNLADQVKAASLDPIWAERCAGLSEVRLEDLRDAARTVLDYRGRWWRLASSSYRLAKACIRSVRPGVTGAALWTSAESLLAHLEARRLRTRLAQMNEILIPQAPFRKSDEQFQVRFPQIASAALQNATWLCRAARTRRWLDEWVNASLASEDRALLDGLLARAKVSIERGPILADMLVTLHGLGSFFNHEGLDGPRQSIANGFSITEWIEAVKKGMQGLDHLIALDLDREDREGLARDVLGALEEYERDRQAGKSVPTPGPELPDAEYGKWWAALVRYTTSIAWQGVIEKDYPDLIKVTPEAHAAKVRALRELLSRKRGLEADAIRAHWATRQEANRDAPWPQIFAHRTGKINGGAKTLRQAIGLGLSKGLLDMRPCWFANPASVSQIFPLEAGLFDLVIFDEASQCPIEQALPGIYRGKTLIVSGDEKQLPPTGFFSASALQVDEAELDDDDLEGEATDQPVGKSADKIKQLGPQFMLGVKDLLEAAVALFSPEARAHLLVHYRSRHQALIDFSNHAFYEGRLESPPSARGRSSGGPPILYHHVNGTYQDRTNRDEARKVVAILRDFWLRAGSCPTIGVVTFNKPQQELIEDLIEDECRQDEAFDVRFKQELSRRLDKQDVGFFVRNLENVQGDERDVMLFSTTFGRNSSNVFRRNFGPVGHADGERRLNVAVTRARDQVIIVGSMPINEIGTALGAPAGPAAQLAPSGYLQLYLAYAEAVSSGDRARTEEILRRLPGSPRPNRVDNGPETPFEQEVFDVLERWGMTVDCQVGDSGFRIDLALRHSDPSRGYALGIECDGATYHSDRSARARDVWREDILRGRGWKFHRIWSTRWWSRRDQEIAALKDQVERALGD
jgi:primosomal replication protein N''